MGVSLVRYLADQGEPSWGILDQNNIRRLDVTNEHHADVMSLFFGNRDAFDEALSGSVTALDQVELLAPLSRRIQLIAQGLNYVDHRIEGGFKEKSTQDASETEENLLFFKASSTISSPNATILRPANTQLLDYEIELGIVLKRDVHEAVEVTEDNLNEYLGGIVLCNDVSSRDEMFGAPAMQWYKGKSQRTFCPTGPVLYLMEAQDFEHLYSLELELKLNGVTKQAASTSQLIHKPPKTISELSRFNDLNAGDCVLTGTPGGVLTQLTPKSALAILLNMRNDAKRRQKFTQAQLAQTDFLKPGDRLELSISTPGGEIDLGCQNNDIADA
ncbi:MAG: fumarylacetoacetate hydrolase family protein [Pseudomonadota bacterium]